MSRFALLVLCVVAHCWIVTDSNTGRAVYGNTGGKEPAVVINVLSRPLRLLSEGRIPHIVFTSSHALVLNVAVPREAMEQKHVLPANTNLLIEHQNGRFQIRTAASEFIGPCTITILPTGKESSPHIATARYSHVRRDYPLPVTIDFTGNTPVVSVRENLQSYCLYSSLAEYGRRPLIEKEALLALAHVVRARYYYQKRHGKKRHAYADFCDLTHCQVYKGRFATPIIFDDTSVIDPRQLQENMYFHANSCGHTLGTRVFGGSEKSCRKGVRDWLYRQGTDLCKKDQWQRKISQNELRKILFPEQDRPTHFDIRIDRKNMRILIDSASHGNALAPETFRLRLNRKKGWNYLKSNNYTIKTSIKNNEKLYVFTGAGLGHGAGLSQEGALTLARKGYSRYEILEHYYPDITFTSTLEPAMKTPYLLYCLFDLSNGKIRSISNPGMVHRMSPPGSIFKIVVALYLGKERPDLFREYTYTCPGKNRHDKHMPARCWLRKGHGALAITGALSHSCNLWFASLYKKISSQSFRRFYDEFCQALDISSQLPPTGDKKKWAEMLSGTDFSISYTVKDFIKIVQLVSPLTTHSKRLGSFKNSVPLDMRMAVFAALHNTFLNGTASGEIRHYGSALNYQPLEKMEKNNTHKAVNTDIWGKTSTVLDGTNKALCYGQFIGGYKNLGIVVILRNGYGHTAAHWARVLLQNWGR